MPCSSAWTARCVICGARSIAASRRARRKVELVLLGLGIDVASIERIRESLDRFGDRFWERILTENERADLSKRPDRAVALAGRFAAKEAAAKALGGPPDVLWHTIEVRSSQGGAPTLE